MLILIIFAFIAGIVTILSPCIFPLLPIILTSATASGKSRPWGIVLGFIFSFTLFTLFLSTLVNLIGIPGDLLRNLSIIFVLFFGITLLIPQFQAWSEILFARLTPLAGNNQK